MARTFREWVINSAYAVRVPVAYYVEGKTRTLVGVVRGEARALRYIARDFVDTVFNVIRM